jgi:hypothetical protein
MNITENKNIDIKSENEGAEALTPLWNAKFYYTKRTADILKAIAEKKAEKEAERQRVLEL